jgi:hypothetical protein
MVDLSTPRHFVVEILFWQWLPPQKIRSGLKVIRIQYAKVRTQGTQSLEKTCNILIGKRNAKQRSRATSRFCLDGMIQAHPSIL